MPVTHTITLAEVSSVIESAPSSRISAGVTFDWDNQKIYIPPAVGVVTAQWLIDNASFAQSNTAQGYARKPIVLASGKTAIGIDPETGSPITTPVVAILYDEWKIVTQRTGGSFVIRDIYMSGNSTSTIPYDDVAGVFIQYLTTVSGAVSIVSTGSGLSAAQDTRLSDLHATLQSAGVFSLPALANIPGGGASAAAIASAVWGYSGVIAANIINQSQAGLLTSAALNPIAANITELRKETGGIMGVTATVLDAQVGSPGYLRTSDNTLVKRLTLNDDGSVTIQREL